MSGRLSGAAAVDGREAFLPRAAAGKNLFFLDTCTTVQTISATMQTISTTANTCVPTSTPSTSRKGSPFTQSEAFFLSSPIALSLRTCPRRTPAGQSAPFCAPPFLFNTDYTISPRFRKAKFCPAAALFMPARRAKKGGGPAPYGAGPPPGAQGEGKSRFPLLLRKFPL